MKILFFDLETTGLLNSDPEITEIGFSLYDTEEARTVMSRSLLVKGEKKMTQEIVDLTGVTDSMREEYGMSIHDALITFGKVATGCDAYFARNGEQFDIPLIRSWFQKCGFEWINIPCIDDYVDIEYPDWVKGRNLGHICADHGFINPFPHNAVGDCLAMIEIMRRGSYDFAEMFNSAQSPMVSYIANTTYQEREKAKTAGFRWQPKRKIWYKNGRSASPPQVDFEVEVSTTIVQN